MTRHLIWFGCALWSCISLHVEAGQAGEEEPGVMIPLVHACHDIKQCYCIKGTACGWCEALQFESVEHALPGDANGPFNSKHSCPRWITKAGDCNNLICDETNSAQVAKYFIVPAFALLVWSLVLARHFSYQAWHKGEEARLKERINSRGNHAPAIEIELTARTPGQFRPLSELSAMESGIPLVGSVKPQVTSVTPQPQRSEVCHEIEFLRPFRDYLSFSKGLDCPDHERLPKTTTRTYAINMDQAKVVYMLCSSFRVACRSQMTMGAVAKDTCGLGFVSAITISVLRSSAAFMSRDTYRFVSNMLCEIESQIVGLKTMVTFLISFYAIGRIGHWWRVQSTGWVIQGRIHDLGMLASTTKHQTEEDWQCRFQLYRWMMADFFFTYRGLVPRFSQLQDYGTRELETCGLVTAEEGSMLRRCHKAPHSLVETWIAQWLTKHIESQATLQAALQALRELRGNCAGLADLLDQRAPVNFESMLYVMVYLMCLLWPFGPMDFKDLNDREYISENYHIAAVFGMYLKSTFYLGLLHMLHTMQAPFGTDLIGHDDSLYPEQIMLSTENRLRDYLSGSLPEIPEHTKSA